MRDPGIGRVLVASLHQAIADILPTRLTFYENWLHAEGLRDGTIGLAPLYAVLSFLRQEGAAYGSISTRAGEYAAEWTVASMSPIERGLIKTAPAWMRKRLAMRIVRRLVRNSYSGSRAIAKISHGNARVDVRASVFCTVRDRVDHPLCVFYLAAFSRLLTLFDFHSQAEVLACRGTGGSSCVVALALSGEALAPTPTPEAEVA
ncbi:MAG TPA: hypothetical protein VJP86_08355 [Vicinamibacterales bacterium]|jgi:bacteriochlorophyll 4-vinyl reductase|nr:hypothetical protein [Vicinamibacterales bacterium]